MLSYAITFTRSHYKFMYISFNGSLQTSGSGLQILPLLFHSISRFCLNRDTLINPYRWDAIALQSIPSGTVSSFLFLSSIISRYRFVPLSCFFQRHCFNSMRRISSERNTQEFSVLYVLIIPQLTVTCVTNYLSLSDSVYQQGSMLGLYSDCYNAIAVTHFIQPAFTSSSSFPVALRPNAGHGLLILKVSRSHTTTHHSR